MTADVRAKKSAEEAASSITSDTAGPTNGNGGASVAPTAAMTDTPPVQPAKLQGLELGPACQQCGGMMQRTGSCYTCPSCGNNTGCG